MIGDDGSKFGLFIEIFWVEVKPSQSYFECLILFVTPLILNYRELHFPPQDREFVELEVPYNGQAKRPGSPSPLLSPSHSVISTANIFQSCCGRCCGQRYQVRTHRGLGNKLHPIVSWTEWAINLNMYSSFENGYLQQFLNRRERGVRYSQY